MASSGYVCYFYMTHMYPPPHMLYDTHVSSSSYDTRRMASSGYVCYFGQVLATSYRY
jgi:hypothetical protein